MPDNKTNLNAELLWNSVPPETREAILQAVWCGHCRTAVEIADYTMEEKGGDVVLSGRCRVCGQPVRRVVETSEASPPAN
jgi:uncharacterized CHY-type Zn-finger protein